MHAPESQSTPPSLPTVFASIPAPPPLASTFEPPPEPLLDVLLVLDVLVLLVLEPPVRAPPWPVAVAAPLDALSDPHATARAVSMMPVQKDRCPPILCIDGKTEVRMQIEAQAHVSTRPTCHHIDTAPGAAEGLLVCSGRPRLT